jgi:hypothetical protein
LTRDELVKAADLAQANCVDLLAIHVHAHQMHGGRLTLAGGIGGP